MERPARVDPIDDGADGFDVRQVGRSALWTVLAIVTMLGAIAAARSDVGLRRITAALEGRSDGSLSVSSPPAGSVAVAGLEAETRRLGRIVQGLASDRDRMLQRLTALEQSIGVTGSVPKAPQPNEAKPQPGPAEPVAASVTLIPPPSPHGPDRTTTNSAPQIVAPQVTSAQIAAAHAAASVVTHTQFGIDLGAGPDLDALRARWAAIRTTHAELLDGLRPLANLRETKQEGGIALHLIVGPLSNAAVAARLCAAIAAAGERCEPRPFEGQALALP